MGKGKKSVINIKSLIQGKDIHMHLEVPNSTINRSILKDILVNKPNKEMNEMETKTQVEDSIIQESLLTCIDLANSDHQSVLSLKQWVFYVINHGISEEVMDKAFEQSKNFFALPLEEKMEVLKNEKHRGYTPFYDQIPDPENQVQGTCNPCSGTR
ncbi:hypothetical protein YC2023_043722 [Brassica napus]